MVLIWSGCCIGVVFVLCWIVLSFGRVVVCGCMIGCVFVLRWMVGCVIGWYFSDVFGCFCF